MAFGRGSVGEGGRAIGHTWEWVGAKRAEESKRERGARRPHSVTTLRLFAERLQIDPLTLPSGTVYFSSL